jgi:hypothetical protein
VTGLVRSGLKFAAKFIRLLPPRRKPYLRSQIPNRTYKPGFTVDDLGATEPIAK